jgi:hypothetical protein
MMSPLMAYRQRARLLGHNLWVAQRADGKWRVWIEGEKAVEHEALLASQQEAKRVVHSLAHWHIEGKQFCDCAAEMLWQSVQSDFVGSQQERRSVKRINYECDIRCENWGVSRIGRIGNLSTEGAFIQTPNPSFTGSVINLSFQVGRVKVETQGTVVHHNPEQGMGVRFLNLDPGYRAAIADLLIRENDRLEQ